MSQTASSHWSIGEVLSLLQDEFPEITISKIRFLESQGLIDPERTPSGYRRFYESDFDRLRWILVQQRDHYLPLKVIRDRIEAGEFEAEGATPAAESNANGASRSVGIEADLTVDTGVTAGDGGTGKTMGTAVVSALEIGSNESDATEADASGAGTSGVDADEMIPPFAGDDDGESGDPEIADDPEQAQFATVATERPVLDLTDDAAVPVGDMEIPSSELEQVTLVNPRSLLEGETDGSSEGQGVERQASAAAVEADLPPVQLTHDELAEAAGCDQSLLHELERFDLISGRTMGASVVFDRDALEVTTLAAAFADYGLEPRHLRAFRLGAEREVGLISQVIGPMAMRRSPEARDETRQALEEMTSLAAGMREAMARRLTSELFPEG